MGKYSLLSIRTLDPSIIEEMIDLSERLGTLALDPSATSQVNITLVYPTLKARRAAQKTIRSMLPSLGLKAQILISEEDDRVLWMSRKEK